MNRVNDCTRVSTAKFPTKFAISNQSFSKLIFHRLKYYVGWSLHIISRPQFWYLPGTRLVLLLKLRRIGSVFKMLYNFIQVLLKLLLDPHSFSWSSKAKEIIFKVAESWRQSNLEFGVGILFSPSTQCINGFSSDSEIKMIHDSNYYLRCVMS